MEGLIVSERTLYRWTATGRVKVDNRKGRKELNPAALEQARQLIQERADSRTPRRAILMAYERMGLTSAAAKKLIQRRQKAGKTLQEIVRELTSRIAPNKSL